MSIPIRACRVRALARGLTTYGTYDQFLADMKANKACGHWSIHACGHSPECPMPTPAQQFEFERRLEADLEHAPGPDPEKPWNRTGKSGTR